MRERPTNSDDIIDSRDVLEAIEELKAIETRDEDEQAELEALMALAEEGESAADWLHGETLVRDSYFKEYAMQLADDIGAINSDSSWPNNCIDWDRAARELRMDYFSVGFAGVTYWVR